jgi:hypothetical protein
LCDPFGELPMRQLQVFTPAAEFEIALKSAQKWIFVA